MTKEIIFIIKIMKIIRPKPESSYTPKIMGY